MQFMLGLESTVYVQVGIFITLGALYLIFQRKLPTFRFLSFAMLRLAAVIAFFIYLFLNWSSEVNPSLRHGSVLGLFIVNLYLLWHVILTSLELPYRQALDAYSRNPENPELFQNVLRMGKRFYGMRHLWQALVSGGSIWHFLRSITLEHLRADLRRIFHKHGVSQGIFNFQMARAFLKKQLVAEDFPSDFKELMEKVIQDFSGHPWIEEQMNKFLNTLVESPEDLLDKWAGIWRKDLQAS